MSKPLSNWDVHYFTKPISWYTLPQGTVKFDSKVFCSLWTRPVPLHFLVSVQSCPSPGPFGSHLSWCALALPWNNYCKYSFILLFCKLDSCHVKLEKLVQIYLYLYIRFIQDSLNQYSRLSLLSPDCFDFFFVIFLLLFRYLYNSKSFYFIRSKQELLIHSTCLILSKTVISRQNCHDSSVRVKKPLILIITSVTTQIDYFFSNKEILTRTVANS